MRCGECAEARRYSAAQVFCVAYGMIIGKEYERDKGCWKERKAEEPEDAEDRAEESE